MARLRNALTMPLVEHPVLKRLLQSRSRKLHRAIVCRGFQTVYREPLLRHWGRRAVRGKLSKSFVGLAGAGKARLDLALQTDERTPRRSKRHLMAFGRPVAGVQLARRAQLSTKRCGIQRITIVKKS